MATDAPVPDAPALPARPWAGKRFLDLLATHAGRLALERGRPILRQGRVLDLAVAPGRVTADVEGPSATPLHVRISLGVFPASAWDRAERRLAGEASRAARLLAGEMPEDIEEIFAACRVALFPAEAMELRAECSCTEASDPCRHVAATYLRLAQRFDEDPFLLLAWRGRTRAQLLERLRSLRAQAGELAMPETAEASETAVGTAEAAPTAPDAPPIDLPVEPEPTLPSLRAPSFWGAAPLPRPPDEPLPRPGPPDAVLREMGPLPIDDPALIPWLAAVYAAVADATTPPSSDE